MVRGKLRFARGIEVGHVFQLGDRYSRSMAATVLDEAGKAVALQMGCYGLGVSRVIAAAIEQSHDQRGIIWSRAMAPFDLVIIPVQLHKSDRVRKVVETLYQQLSNAGYQVLVDDRKERPGVMFADMDLIGIPHRLVIGERGLDSGCVEYKARNNQQTLNIPTDKVLSELGLKFADLT